ncbi:hypothetical protein ABW365_05680 [Enterococcus avium]
MDNSVMMAVAMALVYWLSRGMIGDISRCFSLEIQSSSGLFLA